MTRKERCVRDPWHCHGPRGSKPPRTQTLIALNGSFSSQTGLLLRREKGMGGLYRSPPGGRNWRKTGYSWSEVTSKGNTGKEQRRLAGCAKSTFLGKALSTTCTSIMTFEAREWWMKSPAKPDCAIKNSANRKRNNVQACSLDTVTAMVTLNPELWLVTITMMDSFVDIGKPYLLHTAHIIMDGYV